MKSRYLSEEQEQYPQQRAFDEKLAALSDIDLSGFGPSLDRFTAQLEALGYQLEGFD